MIKELAVEICEELRGRAMDFDDAALVDIAEKIDKANNIFCVGLGRSKLSIMAFAMRLMHMGRKSYMVGETCTPNITDKGLLVVCSGSGTTKSLVNHANKAKEVGAKVALITINPESTIGKLADVVIEIPAVSPKSDVQGAVKSIQPMGSLFEQSEGIYMDIIIMMLMEKLGLDSDTMFGRHANME